MPELPLDAQHQVAQNHLWFQPHQISYEKDNVEFKWKSRNQRKGKKVNAEKKEQKKTFALFKPWDISWWTAIFFLVGSAAWVVNGVFVFHQPSALSGVELSNSEKSTAFLGGFFFLCGGWTMYLEALNTEESMFFDEAVRKEEKNFLRVLEHLICPNLAREQFNKSTSIEVKWRWIGWDGLTNLSFSANFSQFLGTMVFFISVLSGLPGVLPNDETSHRAAYIVVFWVPQVIGSFFLTVSSFLLMIENQPNLYTIEPCDLGWHIGFWNILGSLGFFFSGLFGIIYPPQDLFQREWSVSFTTYMGAYFYLIGSIFQYYESCIG